MGLNLSNQQIGQEFGLNKNDVQQITTPLWTVVVEKTVRLEDDIEGDELYLVAGHKGYPDALVWQGRPGRRRLLKGQWGAGTLAAEKLSISGYCSAVTKSSFLFSFLCIVYPDNF